MMILLQGVITFNSFYLQTRRQQTQNTGLCFAFNSRQSCSSKWICRRITSSAWLKVYRRLWTEQIFWRLKEVTWNISWKTFRWGWGSRSALCLIPCQALGCDWQFLCDTFLTVFFCYQVICVFLLLRWNFLHLCVIHRFSIPMKKWKWRALFLSKLNSLISCRQRWTNQQKRKRWVKKVWEAWN